MRRSSAPSRFNLSTRAATSASVGGLYAARACNSTSLGGSTAAGIASSLLMILLLLENKAFDTVLSHCDQRTEPTPQELNVPCERHLINLFPELTPSTCSNDRPLLDDVFL